MLNLKPLAFAYCCFAIVHSAYSQLGFSHEIGVIAGPVEFRSDYGGRLKNKLTLAILVLVLGLFII